MTLDGSVSRQSTWVRLVLLTVVFSLTPPLLAKAGEPAWQVYFSPNGGTTKAIVNVLSSAKARVLVQAYSFTSAPIAKALMDAHKRGVDVQVILDRKVAGAKYSSADLLAHSEIPTYLDGAHAIAHNKIMVIDSETVVTGSFNFTKAADGQNAENLVVIHDRELAARYVENWQIHVVHSARYAGR
jgi:phosphatidylserine/phosphatidylglycerophosphate/cardiolipin synthase-like enzyme